MNKETLIILAVVAVGAGAAYYFYQKSKQNQTLVATNGNQNARNEADLGEEIQGGINTAGGVVKAGGSLLDDLEKAWGGF